MNSKLLTYISKHVDLSDKEQQHLLSKVKYRHYQKGQYVIQQGDVCTYKSFVISGCIIWMGSGQWSKTFNGKKEVIGQLWSAVRKTLKPPYKVHAKNIIADGHYVVVEAVGENTTPEGKKYQNKYCWVCRIVDGKIYELKEYMDTQLVTETFKS